MRQHLPYFTRYLLIGSLTAVIDLGSFGWLVSQQMNRPLATTISIGLAVCVHFLLNKTWNFRSFDRALSAEVANYGLVAGACWLLAIAVIELCVRVLHLPPVAAKVVSIAVNIPVGFIGHRYLTFPTRSGQLSAISYQQTRS